MPKKLAYNSIRVILMAGASAGVMLASPALAQTAPNADQEAATGLEDVVVTARRRAESVQDIPVAVAAISAEQIGRRDLTSVEKIASSAPQLQIARTGTGSGAQVTMRGIGASSTSIGIESSVAVIVDNIYYGSGRILNEAFFDLDHVEILRGPQALFFGKNATSGVLNLATADPGDSFEFKARTGYEFTAKERFGEFVVSSPLTDTLGVRAGLRYSNMDGGYYTNLGDPSPYDTRDVATGVVTPHTTVIGDRKAPGTEQLNGRVTLKWEPTSDFTATLKGNFGHSEDAGPGWNFVPYACLNGVSQSVPSRQCATDRFVHYTESMPADVASATSWGRPGGNYNDYNSRGLTANLEYRLPSVTISGAANYNWNENEWACNCSYQENNVFGTEHSTWKAYSAELRALTTFDGPLNFMIGGYYQRTDRDLLQNVVFSGAENSAAPAGLRYTAYNKDSDTRGKTLAAFGQLIWKLTPEIEVTAGARYTDETKDSNYVQPYVLSTLRTIFVFNSPLVANQSFDNFSPDVTISYKPRAGINLYAAYKTAYKSGGFSNSGIQSARSLTQLDDFTFDPETVKGGEAGIKTTLFDRQFRFNVGVYRYNYSNLQVDFFNSPIFAFQTINAGSSVAQGVETEMEFAPASVPGLIMRGTLNYNKARYDDFQGPCYTGQTPANGCTLTSASGTPYQDLSGTRTSVAPDWTATLGGSYDRPISDALELGLSLDARYSSSYLASGFGQPMSQVEGYTVIDASVRVRTSDARWELALIGKNLTDELYLTGVGDGALTGSGTGTAAGRVADQIGYGNLPRTVQLQLSFKY